MKIIYHANPIIPLSLPDAVSSDVALSSSLDLRSTAYPQQTVVFTCVTNGSSILVWSSDDYIGNQRDITFTIVDSPGLILHSGTTVATLVSVTGDREVVLESTLEIIASSQFPMSSVACRDVDNGRINQTSFQVSGEFVEKIT